MNKADFSPRSAFFVGKGVKMKILKFGGTSLKDASVIQQVARIVTDRQPDIALVVSAFAGITDRLIRAARQAAQGNTAYTQEEKAIEEHHLAMIRELFPSDRQSSVISQVLLTLNDLHDILHGIFLLRELSPRVLDFVMSFGERLSAYILSEFLNENGTKARYLDARRCVKTNENFGRARVLYEQTNAAIRDCFADQTDVAVITGFIASTLNGETTTLGRSGSDFTASIFAAALRAEEIEIWTDVDGVMTADPQMVPSAFTVPFLSYEEAMELSHFGAQVVHPATMQPALEAHIPIRIKNTFRPEAAGTVIGRQKVKWPYAIKSLTAVREVALISVIGSGMIGETGIAGRIFSTLAREEINIILISQASSEHSVCFAVAPHCAQKARQALQKELRLELLEKRVNRIQVEPQLSIIAVVGENMRRTPGIAGKVFMALGEKKINIVAIAQGSSELNISLVLAADDLPSALNAIHRTFFERENV